MMQPKIHQTYQPLPFNSRHKPAPAKDSSNSFQNILNQQLTLTKHAKERLNERNIDIPPDQWAKITEKITEAKDKGVRDSLVLTEEAALIVNTKNNTVITAMDKQSAESRLFTNIDGTIIM